MKRFSRSSRAQITARTAVGGFIARAMVFASIGNFKKAASCLAKAADYNTRMFHKYADLIAMAAGQSTSAESLKDRELLSYLIAKAKASDDEELDAEDEDFEAEGEDDGAEDLEAEGEDEEDLEAEGEDEEEEAVSKKGGKCKASVPVPTSVVAAARRVKGLSW